MKQYHQNSYDENGTDESLCDAQLQSVIRQTVRQTIESMRTEGAPAAEKTKTVDLGGLFFFILEKFWCILLSAVIFSAIFGWGALNSTPIYTATAKLYIVNPASSGISISDLQLGTVLTLDYQEVFKTWEVHEMVREELNLPITYEQMQSMLTVTNPEDTRILYITVRNSDAQLSADIANAYAKAAKEFIMNTMKGEQPSDFSIALVPGVAAYTSWMQSALMGFLVGTVLAAGILMLIFILDSSPKTPEDVSKYAGLSTLAILPVSPKAKKGKRKRRRMSENGQSERQLRLTSFPEVDSISAEGLNTLVTNLAYCGTDVRKIMITSRYSSEGKSYVTMNLMRALARMGRKVVVVDTDLRASGIQAGYGLEENSESRKGLSEYLAGHCEAEQAIYRTNIPNAWIIPAGHGAPNPLQLLDTEKMKKLVEDLSTRYDVVLLDTPPVGILVDAIAMAKFCDGAVLVVGYHKGKLSEVEETARRIRQTGCSVLGAVLNEVRLKSVSNRHYYYSRKYTGYTRGKRGEM